MYFVHFGTFLHKKYIIKLDLLRLHCMLKKIGMKQS
jgi:hypothetical protein